MDSDHNVLHFSGDFGRYISPSRGSAGLNLFDLVHPDLRLDLRTAMSEAAETLDVVRVPNARLVT